MMKDPATVVAAAKVPSSAKCANRTKVGRQGGTMPVAGARSIQANAMPAG
jgi:hypothetical protein